MQNIQLEDKWDKMFEMLRARWKRLPEETKKKIKEQDKEIKNEYIKMMDEILKEKE